MGAYPNQRGIELDPTQDGLRFINVWSKANTQLGRMLSNMAPIGVQTPSGFFISMEGYWWWLSTGCNNPAFKNMNAFEARKLGKSLKRIPIEGFEDKIKSALTDKVRSNRCLHDLLTHEDNMLPLCHYYVYGTPPDCKVIPANNSLWQLDHLEQLRDELRTSIKSP